MGVTVDAAVCPTADLLSVADLFATGGLMEFLGKL